jgi:hypothetical protein
MYLQNVHTILKKDRDMKRFTSLTFSNSRLSKHHLNFVKGNRFFRFLYPLMGLVSLIWLLIRIIPKPSRAEYPCMKVAAPIASGFVFYIITLLAAIFSFKKARSFFRNSQYTLATIFILAGAAAGLFSFLQTDN